MTSNLADYLTRAGITGAELARKADISEKTVSRAKKGRVTAPTTLYRILHAYNALVPDGHQALIGDLFPGAPEMPA